ncbi:ATP-binding protein [Paenibacillus sp. N1-5-1-14]|uniref:PAS domain-containing sensor histidine kinase n=1 Tax=Paenibacillus radicibacter TaxID=2972488 RepID=UPI0021597AD1|nr:PAS domain-containing sensor histidine kinase [Paenibacillus radicibacter]MCR8642559.1 ATP-binding protein [Paenibacillus radicibacter]
MNTNNSPGFITFGDLSQCWSLVASAGVIQVDANYLFVRCDINFESLTGYESIKLLGMPISDIVVLELPLQELCSYGAQASEFGSRAIPYYLRIRTSKGTTVVKECKVIKLEGDRGGYILFLEDVEENVKNLFERFSGAFLEDVNLGVLLVDTEFTLVDISNMACQILGFNKDAVLGKPMNEVFMSVPIEYRLVQSTILDGVVVRNHAMSWMNDQKRYELLLDSNVLRDKRGAIVGAYVIFKDVSNLRSLEQQVERSDRLAMIGQIAAGAAHEIRNPLTSIKGFLQVFRKSFDQLGLHREQEYVDIMLDEINRVNELVNEFLKLSKSRDAKFQKTNITGVLRGLMPIIQSEALLHNVQLSYETENRLPDVIADQEMLKQVFLNICKNGIEAMVEGGTLSITERVDVQERNVRVEIHDTGPGIPLYVIDKIFDPFFTTKEEGTGLGLSVCQRIIHDLGGQIRVSSKGFGTTFTICIPYP